MSDSEPRSSLWLQRRWEERPRPYYGRRRRFGAWCVPASVVCFVYMAWLLRSPTWVTDWARRVATLALLLVLAGAVFYLVASQGHSTR